MRGALVSLLTVCALGALGWFLWFRAAEPPVEAQAEPQPIPEPFVVSRRPVQDPVAAPRVDGLAGVEARWVRTNNEATLLLGDGELGRAVAMFEQCYEALPERNVFRHNLAEGLVRLARSEYEARELEPAIEHLGRAVELVPDRDDVESLKRVLARWKSELEVEANHWTEGSDLFELSYDTDRDDILRNAQDVLDHLERAYEELRLWFGQDPVREGNRRRIRVVLYSAEEFDRLTGLGDWAGGVFDGVVRIAVRDVEVEEERWRRVLTHELVHAFIREVGGPSVPGWLNEGLAQLLDATDPPVENARRTLQGHTLFTLDELAGSLASWSDRDAILRAYAQSLLLVHRIATDYGEQALLVMVAGCTDDTAVGDSFEAWTQVPLDFVVERLAD